MSDFNRVERAALSSLRGTQEDTQADTREYEQAKPAPQPQPVRNPVTVGKPVRRERENDPTPMPREGADNRSKSHREASE